MTHDDWSRIEITPLFQGFGLSPDFFALGVRGLQRSLRRELYSLPLALGVAPTLSAHLDDINGIAPLETMPNFLDKIRELGPEIGLHLAYFLKNYFYVPLRFKDKFFFSFLPKRRPIESSKLSRMKRWLPSRRNLKRWRRRSGGGSHLRMEKWLGRS